MLCMDLRFKSHETPYENQTANRYTACTSYTPVLAALRLTRPPTRLPAPASGGCQPWGAAGVSGSRALKRQILLPVALIPSPNQESFYYA